LLKNKLLEHAGCGTPEIDAFLERYAAGVVTNWEGKSQMKAQVSVTMKQAAQNGDVPQSNVEGRNEVIDKE